MSQVNNLTAILDEGTQFEGKLTFEGAAEIGGDFTGEIFTQDVLVISSTARVQGVIEAKTVILQGRFEGQIFAREKIVMNPPAVFKGTVTSPSLKIEEGVVFEGASYMLKN